MTKTLIATGMYEPEKSNYARISALGNIPPYVRGSMGVKDSAYSRFGNVRDLPDAEITKRTSDGTVVRLQLYKTTRPEKCDNAGTFTRASGLDKLLNGTEIFQN